MGSGRPKANFKPLECEERKRDYFYHEKYMITERIRHLSILTGADILYLFFNPSGTTPFICLGQNTEFSEIIRRYAAVPFKERERRRDSNLETLRNRLEEQDRADDVNIHELRDAWKRKRLDERNEELRNQKRKLSVINQKTSFLGNPKNIKDVELIDETAERLKKTVEGLRRRKDYLSKLRQELQNEAAAEQVPVQHSPSLHNGTIHQGVVNENSQQSILQRNAEPDAFSSRADLGSIGFDLDLEGFDLDLDGFKVDMEELDNIS